jgi:hypothetical protein
MLLLLATSVGLIGSIAAGCGGDEPAGSHDMAVGRDLSVARDLSTPRDLAVRDMARRD